MQPYGALLNTCTGAPNPIVQEILPAKRDYSSEASSKPGSWFIGVAVA